MKTLNKLLLITILAVSYNISFGQHKKLEKLHSRISTTAYDEFAPCISADGLTLYFTRTASPEFEHTLIENNKDLSKTLSKSQFNNHLGKIYSQLAGRPVANPTKSVFNQDIWMAQTAVKDFDILLHPAAPLNNALPNSISAVAPTSNEVILVNQFVEKGGMKKGFSKSKRNADGSWDFPQPIDINNFHNSGTDVNLSISQDGKVMVMALEREDAYGRSDLYICFKQSNGIWTEPKNLGRGINTPFREATPHLSADMTRLYFSSDRDNNKGHSNIFVQKRIGPGWDTWSAPQRFRDPINSKASDSHPYFCQNTGHLYFSSNRAGTWDIYRIKISPPKPTGLLISGSVVNQNNMQPVDALITSGDGYGNTIVSSTRNGQFTIRVPWGQKIKILARNKDFKEAYTVITTGPAMKTDFVKKIQLKLEPLEPVATEEIPAANVVSLEKSSPPPTVGAKLEVDDIFFLQSTAEVLKKSYPQLDRLGNYLRRNRHMHILISGHTDNQGDEVILKKLSVDRAAAIKAYLVQRRNIAPDRIKTIGYGSTRSINDNSTEKLRKQNRRVEIEIIELENDSINMTKTK